MCQLRARACLEFLLTAPVLIFVCFSLFPSAEDRWKNGTFNLKSIERHNLRNIKIMLVIGCLFVASEHAVSM
jgi:hypothetical protein